MDARELTKEYIDIKDRVIKLERQVSYLTQELEKQRLLMDDMKIDVQMLQNDVRRR
jgi:hypothetical protein